MEAEGRETEPEGRDTVAGGRAVDAVVTREREGLKEGETGREPEGGRTMELPGRPDGRVTEEAGMGGRAVLPPRAELGRATRLA